MNNERNEMESVQHWKQNYMIFGAILIVLLGITASAGLFGSNIYEPFTSAKYVQESRAQDLITLAVGIPLQILGIIAYRRERYWSIPLWTGVLAYELYVYGIYAIGAVYNFFFLGYVAVASLSMYIIIGLIGGVNQVWFQKTVKSKIPRRWLGGFFLVIVLVFSMIWLSQVLKTISTGVVDSGHLIFVFDLMIVLPAFGITAIKLFHKELMGDILSGLLLIKFDSLCISISLGQLFRSMNGISVESELLSVFIPLGLIGLIFTTLYFKNVEK